MGGSTHSDDVYTSRMAFHASTKTSAFTYDADVKSGAAPAIVHEKLDPKKLNAAGRNVRESFDSDVHPDSVPVAIMFDVTGSMDKVPRVFVEKLGKLMAMLVAKSYIAHPHVLFGAIGDATCDQFPLQVGQFEGGNEMDEALTKIVLEAGGGGHNTESYELAAYYLAERTDLDSVKKREKKGYCFFMGDELPYPTVNKQQVKKFIGDNIEANIRFSADDPRKSDSDADGDILAKLREKFEVFWIMPGGTNHWSDSTINNVLKKIFKQNYLRLEDPANVCELIATTIGVCEGIDIDTVASDLKTVGSKDDAINMATKAMAVYTATPKNVVKHAVASGELVVTGDDAVARL